MSKLSVKKATSGHTYDITVTDKYENQYIYEVSFQDLGKITYNGVVTYLAKDERLKVADQTTTKLLLQNVASNGTVTYSLASTISNGYVVGDEYVQNDATISAASDRVLVDGYEVQGTSTTGVTPEAAYGTDAGNNYLPAGAKFTLTAKAGDTIYVKNAAGDKTLFKTNSTTGTEYTMPAEPVVFSNDTTPVQVTIDWDVSIPNGILVGTKGSYKVTCDAMSGESKGEIRVTVETTKTIDADSTLTLSDTTNGGDSNIAPANVKVEAGKPIGTTYQFTLTLGTKNVTLKLADA